MDFETFYRANWAQAVRIGLGATGSRAAGEELAQEAFTAALRRWRRVGSMDRPDLWVRRVVLNSATSRFRRIRREAKALARLDQRSGGEVDVEIEAFDGTDELLRALQVLSSRQRSALLLSALEGCTCAEIGEVLEVSEETARTHLRRARARMRTELSRRER